MTQILDSRIFRSESTNAPIGFKHSRSTGIFDRFLTLEGEAAYNIGLSCGTCYFLFERLGGANRTVSVQEIDETLREGIKSIDSKLLRLIAPIIPQGDYIVNLLEMTPELVAPLSPKDYFNNEQVTLWDIDPFWGLPHYPKTEYYRTHTQEFNDRQALYEFVVPMIAKNWLERETCEMFTKNIAEGSKPTALAIAVLDVKQPATWSGEQVITEHWCYAHFLLDGHHKMFTAHQLQKPITLLSFLAVNECISSPEQFNYVQRLLSKPLISRIFSWMR